MMAALNRDEKVIARPTRYAPKLKPIRPSRRGSAAPLATTASMPPAIASKSSSTPTTRRDSLAPLSASSPQTPIAGYVGTNTDQRGSDQTTNDSSCAASERTGPPG